MRITFRSCVVVLAAILISSSISTLAQDSVTLTFWKASHGETQADWDALLQPFEEATGINVEVVSHPWEGWDERYVTAFIGGTAPDVSYMPDEFWPRFAAAGQLTDMSALFANELEAMAADYPANLWELGTYEGKRFGIPYLFVAVQLFYNRDLFDAAGIEYPPSSPNDPNFADWTWERFAEVAQQLTQDTDGDGETDQWGFAWSVLFRDPNFLYPFLWQAGADILDVPNNTNGFGNERGAAAFTFIRELIDAGVIPDGGLNPNFQQVFYEGKAAMAPVESYSIATVRRDFPELNIGAAMTPQGPGIDFYDGRGSFGNAGFWVIAEASEHKAEAFQLIQYLNRPDNLTSMMDIIKLFGARVDWQPPTDEPLFQAFIEGQPYLVPYPLHPRLRQVHSLIIAEAQAMVLGEKSPEQAIMDAAAMVDELLAQP